MVKVNKDFKVKLKLNGTELKFNILELYKGICYNMYDTSLKNGIYFLFSEKLRKPAFVYLENLEWYFIDRNNKLIFLGYSTDNLVK